MPDYGEDKRRSWQVPAFHQSGDNKKEVHEWFRAQIRDGIDYLEASPGYCQLEEAIRILSGKPPDDLADKQEKQKYSKASTNRLKRNLREMVNSLSEIRYNPAYHSKNKEHHGTAETFNAYGEHWWSDSFADREINKALQWAAISPCGWLEICFREIPGKRGIKKIDLIPMSWFDVVMTGVPDNGDFQQAYTVTIIKDLPVFQAHALFPDFQKELKPDRETPKGWIERIKEKARQVMQSTFDAAPEKTTAKNPTVRIYYQFVLDLALNKTGKKLKMGYEKSGANGEERFIETPWSYDVPYVGEMIPAGYDTNGTMTFRPARPEECRIFPGRRLLIGTDKDLLYDGPMFDWHGQVPLIKICGDPWVFGDFSMAHDLVPMHDVINEIDRIAHQTLRNRFDPTLLYNNRALPQDKAKSIRADVQGQRIGYNGQEVGQGGPMSPLFPKEFNVIEAWVSEYRKYLMDDMDYESGVRNFDSLAKLKMGAGAGGDFIDDALKGVGPIVKGIARDMERSMRDLADMFKFYILQYETSPRILNIVGPDLMTPSNYDYEPGNLIPSHLPGENKSRPSIFTKMQKARWMADQVEFIVHPGTLHEITQTKYQMLLLQLWRQGFPISPQTLAEKLHLGNFGPAEGSNEIDKYFNWKKKELLMMAELQQLKQELFGEEGGVSSNTPNAGAKGGQKGTGGRPPSGKQPPTMSMKDGGARTTVRET